MSVADLNPFFGGQKLSKLRYLNPRFVTHKQTFIHMSPPPPSRKSKFKIYNGNQTRIRKCNDKEQRMRFESALKSTLLLKM
jgi:hypothetical protein